MPHRPQPPSEGPKRGSRTGPSVDLHGLRPSDAMRRLERELHSARVRGAASLEVITGAGHGNRRGEPVLRPQIEAWLRTPEARSRGVKHFERSRHGGSLHVILTT